ncbi:MAG: 6-phosphofructokinase [Oligoflexia bacterium]|nr:6-phosphofructokinase [Oligoflexia bacterium]
MGGNLAIAVSGGPAPGINSVIHAVVIEGRKAGMKTYGMLRGFDGVARGDSKALIELTIDDVSRIYRLGGSVLGTSRCNPLATTASCNAFRQALASANIDKLVVVGGDGSAWVSLQLYKQFPDLQVVHVPKTIDNDLILPHYAPSFGFETARSAGTVILENLLVDAATTERWYIVTTMGRRAGFLALGIGIAAGVTLTLIPEEFSDRLLSLPELAGVIFDTIQLRHNSGKSHGLVLLAEGLIDRIDPSSSTTLAGCPRDDLGRLHYAEIELGDILLPALRDLCKARGINGHFTTKNIGYELRCMDPISFDVEYTRFLGYGAIKYLKAGLSGVMVTREHDAISYQKLSDLTDSRGLIRSRRVDVASEYYQMARSFMIRP